MTNYYTIAVVFDKSDSAKHYTYKVDNTMKVVVDDIVIVNVGDKYKFCLVMAINVKLKSSITYKYIVNVLDTTKYDEIQRL